MLKPAIVVFFSLFVFVASAQQTEALSSEDQKNQIDALEKELEAKKQKLVQSESQASQAQPQVLGQRKWSLDPSLFLSLVFSNKYAPKTGKSRDRSGHAFDLKFGYNFSWLELGPIVRYSYFDYETSITRSNSWGAFFDVNLVENKVGVPLVPFIRGTYVVDRYEDSKNSFGFEETINSKISKIAVGTKWFPMGEIVSLNGYLEYWSTDYSYVEKGSAEVNYTISGPRLLADVVIYF